jgi:hypothetical protein
MKPIIKKNPKIALIHGFVLEIVGCLLKITDNPNEPKTAPSWINRFICKKRKRKLERIQIVIGILSM